MKEYLKMANVFELPIYHFERCGFSHKILDCNTYELGAFTVEDQAQAATHAINSHDDLVVEVKRLSSSLNHANSNHELFERQYYLEKDKTDGLQLEVEQLQQEVERLNSLMLERTKEPGPY